VILMLTLVAGITLGTALELQGEVGLRSGMHGFFSNKRVFLRLRHGAFEPRLHLVGRMIVNRIEKEFFASLDQIGFSNVSYILAKSYRDLTNIFVNECAAWLGQLINFSLRLTSMTNELGILPDNERYTSFMRNFEEKLDLEWRNIYVARAVSLFSLFEKLGNKDPRYKNYVLNLDAIVLGAMNNFMDAAKLQIRLRRIESICEETEIGGIVYDKAVTCLNQIDLIGSDRLISELSQEILTTFDERERLVEELNGQIKQYKVRVTPAIPQLFPELVNRRGVIALRRLA